VFTTPDKLAVEHAGAEGVLGGAVGVAAGVVAAAVGWLLVAAAAAGEEAVDAGLPAELLLLVDPQAAARAPVHSRAAAALIRRAAWADGLIGVPLVGGAVIWRSGPLAVAHGMF
jgi:hypothetical protein